MDWLTVNSHRTINAHTHCVNKFVDLWLIFDAFENRENSWKSLITSGSVKMKLVPAIVPLSFSIVEV